MIIVGDIASPDKECSQRLHEIFKKNAAVFSGKSLVCNLEGLLTDEIDTMEDTPVLFNHPSVMETLKNVNTIAVGLANNHTLDIPQCYDQTEEMLNKYGFAYSGAGKSPSEALQPALFKDGKHEVAMFNLCWDFLLYHQKNPNNGVFVATIDEHQLLREMELFIAKFPHRKVMVYFHWSFDLEKLPFPLYRQLSKALIDLGVKLVVGCHSHCVQGGESYNDGHIVYGLGNFYIPWNTFIKGTMDYPEFSRTELAIEWDIENNRVINHWFTYLNDDEHDLKWEQSVPFEKDKELKKYSPFATQTHEEYISYYKQNRRKKVLIPVYSDYNNVMGNRTKTILLKTRAKLARFMATYGLRKWNN